MRIIRKLIGLMLLVLVSLGVGYYYGSQGALPLFDNLSAKKTSKIEKYEKKEKVNQLNGASVSELDTSQDKQDTDLAIIENKIHELVNQERKTQGVSELTINSQLTKASRQRSNEIVTDFSHERNGESSFSIFKESEYEYIYQAVGENIVMATYQGTPEDMGSYFFKLWKESPGHYENMISPKFSEVGTGVYLKDGILYGTQLFGNPRS